MADNLQVEPVQVAVTGDHLDVHADVLRAGHAQAQATLASAQSGFIGSSSAALSSLAAHWESESSAHVLEVRGHAANMRDAATRYRDTDAHGAADIDATSARPADDMSL